MYPGADSNPDDVLLAGFSARDPRLALAFVRRFQRVVYGVALSVIGDAGLAEDVAQQAFEHAWQRADSYDPRRGSVRTWLIRIAHNLAVDLIRIRRPIPITAEDLNTLISNVTDTPERRALAAETAAEMRVALARLPVEQARAVVMAAVYGMTARQVAGFEGIPLGTAKARIHAALSKLHAARLAWRGDNE